MILNRKQKEQCKAIRNNDSIIQILSEEEFKQLSKEIKIPFHQQQNLVDLLYCSQKWQTKEPQIIQLNQSQITPYEKEYRKWKEQAQNGYNFDSTYASALALIDKKKQKEETKRLIKQHNVDKAIFHFQEKNPFLNKLKAFHQQELIAKISEIKNKQKIELNSAFNQHQGKTSQYRVQKKRQQHQQIDSINKQQQLIQLAVQKEFLNRIKLINEKERLQQQKQKEKQEMKKKCFVNLIKSPPQPPPIKQQPQSFQDKNIKIENSNPPSKVVKKNAKDTHQIYQYNYCKSNKQVVKQLYKLNIEEILKIPYKNYLIFYSDNYHQLLGLTSPEEMKRLDKYRNEALERQEALQKLKEKVASYGPQIIQKLPSTSRQKLFRLLYEKQLQLQKYNQS